MKYLNLMLIAIFTMSIFTACGDDEPVISQPELTSQEIAQLQFMIEEEKLARDVYTYLYDIHGLFVFNNISGSEQKHISFVEEIMNKYNVENPMIDEIGVFKNSEIQNLYNTLTAQGTPTLKDALIVGATIEDLDLNDLQEAIAETQKEDVIKMYNILSCGSRNHMRGFTGQLDNIGETYQPQFISQAYYNEVLAGSHESCGSL